VKIAVAILAVVAIGCAPSAPDAPRWQTDVMPIVAANCLRCHGYPAIGGAPSRFRLDSFDPVAVSDDPSVPLIDGAASVATAIASRVDAGEMPPRFPLDDHRVDTLVAWASMDPPERGEPRATNRAPSLTVTELGRDGATIHLEYELADPDRDLVVGQLRAIGAGDRLVAPIQSGRIEVYWSAAGLPPGDYALEAVVDDGAGPTTLDAGTIAIGGP
jgi:hypothetical protein